MQHALRPIAFALAVLSFAVPAAAQQRQEARADRIAYGLVAVLLTHALAARLRAQPWIARTLNRLAGVCLLGFGIRLALSK